MELSVEGHLFVIITYVSQTSRFGKLKRIQNPVKHLGWSFFERVVKGFQALTAFVKCSIVDVYWGSEYTSGYTGLSAATKTELS